MALKAGYYGVKKAILDKINSLAGALVIKSLGEGLELSDSGELSCTATGGVDYSTTEQDTGLKWVDGRTVYKRVGQFAQNTEIAGTWVEVPNVQLGEGYMLLDVRGVSDTGTFSYLRGATNVSSTSSNNLNVAFVGGTVTVKHVIIEYVKPSV